MSLVGTRPPTAGEYAQYSPHHKRRLSLKPGITGMWQVSGRSDITDFEEVVKLDLKYIDRMSIDKNLMPPLQKGPLNSAFSNSQTRRTESATDCTPVR